MLEKLRIVDFQSHEDTRIRFDPHVTVIVGASDVGKSAVLRALRWLMTNRPRGDAFVRDGTNSTSVMLWLDGQKVSRFRGKTSNGYKLGQDDLFKAVSSDVPEPISNLLNVSDVNFQGQHDAPYWLSLTPGETAKRLNEIVDLEVIDRVHERIASRLRKVKTMMEVTAERLDEARRDLAALEDVPKMVEAMDALTDKRRGIESLSDSVDDLSSLLDKYGENERRMVDVPDLSRLESMRADILSLTDDLESLTSLLKDIESAGIRLKKCQRELDSLETELDDLGICPTCGRPWEDRDGTETARLRESV